MLFTVNILYNFTVTNLQIQKKTLNLTCKKIQQG